MSVENKIESNKFKILFLFGIILILFFPYESQAKRVRKKEENT